MKTSTSEGKRGIQWTSRMQLDDVDFADDLALLSQTQQQMQENMNSVAAASAAVGLNIHKGKSRILRYNTECTNPITIDGEDLEDIKTFTYLGSIIDEQGGSDADVKARIDSHPWTTAIPDCLCINLSSQEAGGFSFRRIMTPHDERRDSVKFIRPITLTTTTATIITGTWNASHNYRYYETFSTVLLNQMEDLADTQLQDQQAGFRKDRSCINQIATLQIVVEQSNSLTMKKHLTVSKEGPYGTFYNMVYLRKSST
ncbi:unnamed protein product [Schistosoma curassoni]|uniref:Reverse transcriptase domain-containing protein n=1 Tax=Schistosoma curassoni TaxID=6186 RepID=A0A183KTE2_9TREM|nr:unnamed protein product [Schistosoma curassoni]